MGKVDFIGSNTLIMTPANDCAGTPYEGHSKSWFYFKVIGVPLQTNIKVVVKRIHMLANQSKFTDYYKPVVKCKGEQWKRVEICNVIVIIHLFRQNKMIHKFNFNISFKNYVKHLLHLLFLTATNNS